MSLTSTLSGAVNTVLGRAGYSLVNIRGGRGKTTYGQNAGQRYAYESIMVLDAYAPWATDDEFVRLWQTVRNNTLTDIWRCYELYQLVRETAKIEGDTVEVGVWRGGTGATLASAARRWKPASRVWLCDTFAGVVKAGANDSAYKGGEHSDTSAQVVIDLLSGLGLDNTEVLTGIFPDETGDALADRPIALCHIDVDVYQSAADTVAWALPRMRSGSVLVFDDYGFSTCNGITQLVNELRAQDQWIYVYNLNKHAIMIRR